MTSSPIRHLLRASWLPQTFAARVFLVFALTTFLGTVVGLVLLAPLGRVAPVLGLGGQEPQGQHQHQGPHRHKDHGV